MAKKLSPGFARWLRDNDGRDVTIHDHQLVEEYDDASGRVPGVTQVPWSGMLVLTDDVRRMIAEAIDEEPEEA